MKKKLILAVTMGSVLALTACSYGQGTVQQASSSEALAETSVCAHEWQEATFEKPKTCTICGETEGEALKDFFTEAGLKVEQSQPRTEQPLQFVTYLSDATDVQVAHTDGSFSIETQVTPANETGFNIVKVTVTHNIPVFSDDSTDGYFDIAISEAFFDLYGGGVIVSEQELLALSKAGKDDFANTRMITVEGKDCEIKFNFSEEWTNSGWYLNDKDAEEDDYVCVRTYEFLVPSEYKGLVFASLPISDYVPAEVNRQGETATDYAGEDALKKATLIRVGR